MPSRALTIGKLAVATGTKVETIRYYESVGLLPAPERTVANYRAFSPTHLARLSFIRRARSLGFSLDQIKALLGLADQKDISCSAVDLIAREHLADIDRKLADLTTLRSELDSLIVQCRHGTISDCRIIESLGPEVAGHDGDRKTSERYCN
ncbi:MAG: helix-turn-helix domain-containing protein [Sphingomonas sp.]|jgi:DNA-binding transcriptional MerR regulator|uniref:MerR family transcriptional regulator n=1 Tax=Sphingomonas sp. TaxID=28214 RepID=UPI003568C65B